MIILCGPFVKDPLNEDLDEKFELFGKLLNKFQEYLQESAVLLVPSFHEDGLNTIPKKCLHEDYLDIIMSQIGKHKKTPRKSISNSPRTPSDYPFLARISSLQLLIKSSKVPNNPSSVLPN